MKDIVAGSTVLEDCGDDVGVLDASDDAPLATALGAGLDVYGKDALQALYRCHGGERLACFLFAGIASNVPYHYAFRMATWAPSHRNPLHPYHPMQPPTRCLDSRQLPRGHGRTRGFTCGEKSKATTPNVCFFMGLSRTFDSLPRHQNFASLGVTPCLNPLEFDWVLNRPNANALQDKTYTVVNRPGFARGCFVSLE